jgi:hypothetical protein
MACILPDAAPTTAASEQRGHDWRHCPVATYGQQASGVALEDEHGVVHMLVVDSVEEAELLLAMGGIVGRVHIQQDFAALANLLSTQAHELIEQGVVKRTGSRAEGAFSQRLSVGWEPSASPSF